MIKKIGIGLLLLAVATIIAINIWHADVYIFKQNVQKYAALNIHQNSGAQRKALVMLASLAAYLPSYPTVPSKQISDIFEKEYNTRHSKAGERKLVTDISELREAVKLAIPGDVITLADGDYEIKGSPITLGNPRNKLDSTLPIIITSDNFKKAKINVNARVGIQITHKDWIMSDLVFEGTCDSDNSCEHAIHVSGDADNLKILGNDFINFNAAIKSNGILPKGSDVRYFPDHVLIQSNRFYNEWTRETRMPVTPIDVVGGDFWTISNNFVADFSRRHKRKSSYTYGAFLKGDGNHGVFKSNFVACMWLVPYYSALDHRIGLSFGGGGTGDQYCSSGECEQEHKGGEMDTNVIANCSQSASIYINRSNNINIVGNVLLGSSGVELRESTDVNIMENLMNGKVRKRDEASSFLEQSNQYFHDQVSFLRQ